MTMAPAVTAIASIPDKQIELELNLVEPIQPLTHDFIAHDVLMTYFPTNLSPTTDQTALGLQIQSKVEQKLADNLLAAEFFRKSSVGKVAQNIKQATNAKIALGGTAAAPTHTLKFDVKAIERRAVVTYEGFVNSNLVYDAVANNVSLTVSKPLSASTVIAFTNVSSLDSLAPSGNVTLTYQF